MLLILYAGQFASVGANTLIGWTATRKSARAVHDALPLLTGPWTVGPGAVGPGAVGPAKVTVLTVQSSGSASDSRDLPTAGIAEHLARHGLDVSAARTVVSDGLSPADALLDYASDVGADLLVVGGYGHSRTREMIMGGVTRDLLRHMTLPVLMSH